LEGQSLPMATTLSQNTSLEAAPGNDALVLIDALKGAAKDNFLQGIKSMTTELDEMMVIVQQDFAEQAEICKNFKQLAQTYRPIRMEAVATVVALKDFADASSTMLIPMLEVALTDGSVSETQEVLQELVETYGSVKDKLEKLKGQHVEISGEAQVLSDDMSSREQQQDAKIDVAGSKADNAAWAVGGGGAGSVITAGVMIVATGSGPVGWTCIGVSAILMAGAGGKLAYENSSSSVHRKLKKACTKLSTHMVKVAGELDRQCKALQMIATKLEGACKSTASIQALVDSWGEGEGKTKMGALKYKLWLTKVLPQQLEELSEHCKSYLTEETQRVPVEKQLALQGKIAVEVD